MSKNRRIRAITATLLVVGIFHLGISHLQQLQLSRHHDRGDHSGFFPPGFDGIDNNQSHQAPTQKIRLHPNPIIYNDIHSMPNFHSSGPRIINPKIPSLYEFRNVCLTNHITSPTLRGLVYLTPPIFDNKERNKTTTIISEPMEEVSIQNNPHRCVPCSAPLNHKGGWNGIHPNEKQVGHKCGFVSVHAMFATNISDWSYCIHIPDNSKLIQKWGQVQIPSRRVESVHFYKGKVLNVAFDRNIGHAMWDHLLTYLPHWYEFRFGGGGGYFPMDGVISHNLRDCMGGRNDAHVLDVTGKNHNDHDVGNPYWYCQILRAINAFGGAEELSLPDATDPLINSTLHCFENLLTLHLSWGRNHGYSVESMPNKTVFDAFREILFDKFDLPRHFRNSIRGSGGNSEEMQDALGEKYLTKSWSGNSDADSSNNQPQRKILFYAHEPSARRVWTNMNSLLATYQSSTKHNQNIIFQNIHDFGNYTIREQAILFNEADAMIMVHGAQMANSIFSVERTIFVELGCHIPKFLGSQTYLSLIDGEYLGVTACANGENSTEKVVCLDCAKKKKDHIYCNFTMSQESFDAMMEHVLSIVN